MPDFIQVETRGGEPFTSGGNTITPFAQSLRIQIPGLPGGLIWNRPVSVLVNTTDGQEQVLHIHDINRWTIWSIFGASLAIVMLMAIIARKTSNRS